MINEQIADYAGKEYATPPGSEIFFGLTAIIFDAAGIR